MFDTMTMTKIVGAFCGAFLIFLLGNWAGETLYHVGSSGHGGHGDHGDEVHQAYAIDTGVETHGEEVEEGPSFAEVFAAADAGRGERLFRACQACHKLEAGVNSTGPSLFGIVGRGVSVEAGFSYSGSLKAVAETWTLEALDAFIENPKGFAPGTKMTYNGMRDIEDRANLIAYLQTIGG